MAIKKKKEQLSLADTIAALNKENKGSVVTLQEKSKIQVISTGSHTINKVTGIGGLPMGRIVEIWGAEATNKTTICLQTVAQAQKAGFTCAYIDVEHALNPEYASTLGVDLNKLLLVPADSGEQALEIVDRFAKTGEVQLMVVDSVALLTPKKEIEGEMGDVQVATLARLMSQAMRKLTAPLAKANCLCIFVNQTRKNVGVLYGPSDTTTGGESLKFSASMRLKTTRGTQIKIGDKVIGYRGKVTAVKNKLTEPWKSGEFNLVFGKGICRSSELIELGEEAGIITKTGMWFSYGDTKLGQGKWKAVDFLDENPDTANAIESDLGLSSGE